MSPRTPNWATSIILADLALLLIAIPTSAFTSPAVSSATRAEWAAPPALPQSEGPQPGRWLLAGLAVVGLVVLAGAAGSLAASVAHLAGMAAAVPGAVGGLGLGMTVYLGRVIAAAGEATSGGTTTSSLSGFLSLLLGSSGSGSSGSVIASLLDVLLSSFLPVAVTLTILGAFGVGITLRLRRRPPGTPSPLAGALGGLLGLGLAFGVGAAFPIGSSGYQSNFLSGDVSEIDIESGAVTLIDPSSLPSLVEGMGLGATPTYTPIPATPTDGSMPWCAGLIGDDPGMLSRESRDWLLAKGMELVSRLGTGELAGLKEVLSERLGLGIDAAKDDPARRRVEQGLGMQLVIELSPQPDPPGLTRWVFRLWSSEGEEPAGVSQEGVPGSGQGMPEGYMASLQAERIDAGTGQWVPLCEDVILPPSVGHALPVTETPPPGPTVTVLQTANCRFGPDLIYPIATSFVQGRVLVILGRSEVGAWWQVAYDGTPGRCWLAGNVVEPSGDLSSVPTVFDPPTPTPTEPPPQPKANVGCFINGVCRPWVCGTQPTDPPNAQPCDY